MQKNNNKWIRFPSIFWPGIVCCLVPLDFYIGSSTGTGTYRIGLFPTCQVRVVRFYQSCSSPPSPPPPPPLLSPPPVSPRPCLHQLPHPLPPCQLVANLFANFRAQWALLDLNCRLPIWVGTAGPQPPGSDRGGHRWTSTWESSSPTSVRTAGYQSEWPRLDLNRKVPQWAPLGTFRAQWAPLDLNRGPSELSGHRWTSTWDLPSSVGTAGPQRPDRMPDDMPDRTPDTVECQIECQEVCQIKCQNVCQILPDRTPEDLPDRMSEDMLEDMSERVPEDMPDRMPEDTSDRMPEDLPATKRINAMVGITRRKVILFFNLHKDENNINKGQRIVSASGSLFQTCFVNPLVGTISQCSTPGIPRTL